MKFAEGGSLGAGMMVLRFVKKMQRPLFDVQLYDENGHLLGSHTDPTQICNEDERPLYEEAVKMFNSVDVDGGGTLDIDEVRQLGEKLGFVFTEKELQIAMGQMDEDGSGEVDFHEFYEWWIERRQSGDYELHNEAVEMFNSVDVDGGGTLDIDEVRQLGEKLGFEFTGSELDSAWKLMDMDGSGAVDFGEFYKWWSVRKQRGDYELHSEAVRMFKAIDVDGGGTLDNEEVHKLGAMLGFKFTESELDAALKEMDADGSGEVDFEEFYEWYVKRKQRGSSVQIGKKMRSVSVHAELVAIRSRLETANDSGDPSELQAALAAAKAVFVLAPAPENLLSLMEELENKLEGADEDLRRINELRSSRPIRAKLLRLWDLMTCESAAIGLVGDPPVVVPRGQATLEGYQEMHIRLAQAL